MISNFEKLIKTELIKLNKGYKNINLKKHFLSQNIDSLDLLSLFLQLERKYNIKIKINMLPKNLNTNSLYKIIKALIRKQL